MLSNCCYSICFFVVYVCLLGLEKRLIKSTEYNKSLFATTKESTTKKTGTKMGMDWMDGE